MVTRASMEPPSFDGGNLASGPWLLVNSQASMEPPSFDGGNPTLGAPGSLGASKLQWSRRLSTAETC